MAKGELDGIKVLVTRPAAQASHLCELIEQAGGEAVRFPLLAVEAANSPQLHHLLARLDSYDLAIFISPNAVRFAVEAAAPYGGIPATLPIAAVGDGSRRALEQQLGRTVDLVPQGRYDSEALLALPQLQWLSGKRIIIFRGNGGRELLADTLRQRGATVDYAEVYQRLRPQAVSPATVAAWQRGAVNIITVTSNESLQNLYEMVAGQQRDWLLGMPLLVVSERGATLAQQLGFRHPALIAGNASDEAIVTTLAGWARERTGSQLPERQQK
jgi:uroporphyrinogen-III synthase